MTPEEYEAKRQAKLDRFKELEEKNRAKSNQQYKQFQSELSVIPPGQPILIGHHSEKRHRAHLGRIDRHMAKSIEHQDKADYYASRASAIESNNAIFSDDPNATEKLAEKIARLEERQKRMVETNKLVRKNDREGLLNLGFSESQVTRLFTPDFCGRTGFADYQLTNNSANIRRLKKRMQSLEVQQNEEESEKTINGIRIVENVDENRLQMFFPGKPPEEVRQTLKHNGFRWSPTNGAWQRHRSNAATWQADKIAEDFKEHSKQEGTP